MWVNISEVVTELYAWGATEAPRGVWRKAQIMKKISISVNSSNTMQKSFNRGELI